MHTSFGFQEDIFHNLQSKGAYEWWYFDGVSTNSDYSFVIIFFVGIPMSATYISSVEQNKTPITPLENCGISVNVYHKNKRIYTALHEGKGDAKDFSSTKCMGKIGNNSFFYDEENSKYSLSIDTTLPNSTTSFVGTIEIKAAPIPSTSANEFEHLWTLVAPRATFEASFFIKEYGDIVLNEAIEGFAYHDHNCGIEPLANHFSQWYWGNIQSSKYSFVFYDVFAFQGRKNEATVTLSTDTSFELLRVEEVRYSQYNVSSMGIRYANVYTYVCKTNDGKTIVLNIKKKRIKEQGPFYLRFAISAEVTIEQEIISDFVGISEYMDAQRLQQQWILPFLKVPLQQF
jgi:hypothetical protein